MIKPSIPVAFKYLNRPMRFKGAYGGRDSGKSWSFADLLLALGMRSSLLILCGREYQKTIKDSVKALLDNTIRRRNLESFYSSINNEVNGKNGTKFIFMGLRHDPDGIKSIEGVDIAWIEEAHTTSQTSLDILIPTIRKKGSELWFSYNRKLVDEPVHKLSTRPNAIFRHINYDQNPFFNQTELVEEMEYDKAHDYDKYLHIWEGEPQQLSDAMVFKGKYSVQCFETPPGAQFYFGADWGFSTDPTTLVRCYIDGRRLFIDQEAYGIHVEIEDTPALFDTVDDSRKWKITADSARPETISYMKKSRDGKPGFRMEGAKKGKDSVIEGVKFLQGYDIVCHERCKHVAYELGRYSYKTDRLTGDVIPELEDKDNHFIDALRYALEGVRRAKPFRVF
jgi:phage terminase large subunit